MQVYINKDIREYQVKDIGPFTLRQAIFSILAVASIFASRAIQEHYSGPIFLCFCISRPFRFYSLDSVLP